MRYEKPEVVRVVAAVEAIQGGRIKSSQGTLESSNPAVYFVTTPLAYEADE